MPFQIIRGNILDSSCDAIINPSDEQLSGEGGLDREIHRLGGSWLDMSCRELAPICPRAGKQRWRRITLKENKPAVYRQGSKKLIL